MPDLTKATNLGQRLNALFEQAEKDRLGKEIEWAESLRQVRGEYDPPVLKRIREMNGSEVYPKITRSKLIVALSRFYNIVFPDVGKNWSISPTPNPSVPESVVAMLYKMLTKQDEQGNIIYPTQEELQSAIYDYVTKACENLERVMTDQLVEMRFDTIARKTIYSAFVYGTGITKGVLVKTTPVVKWMATPDGFVEYKENVRQPYAEFVPIWDFYPDMSVSDFSQCDGCFQRHVYTRHNLYRLAERPDFLGEVIKEYIKDNPKGDATFKQWELDIFSPDKLSIEKKNKYELKEYWGHIDGYDLRNLGVEIEDKALDNEFVGNVWILGDRVIKAVLNTIDDNSIPYHLFYYEKDETSIFGSGFPRIIRDSQLSISAATRMILDNASITSIPQIELNRELLEDNQDLTDFYPRKIWYREGRGADATVPAIRAIEFTSHIGELSTIINMFKQFMDEESTTPTYVYTDKPNTLRENAKGLSFRMANLNITLRDLVNSFDEYNISFLKMLYKWNMLFNPDDSIKGDFQIKAVGTLSQVTKEVQMESLDYFANTLLPEERIYLNTRKFLVDRLRAHNLDDTRLLITEEEAQQKIASMRDLELEALVKKSQQADIEYTLAKALHMLAKSKNVAAKTEDKKEENEEDLLLQRAVKIAEIEKMLADAKNKRSKVEVKNEQRD